MVNRQLYTMKFNSSRLKKFNYDIEIDYNKALENGEIIALSDSQMLRTIREVVVDKTGDKTRVLDRVLLEEFYEEINKIKKRKSSDENKYQLSDVKNKIIKMCFIPEYITIVMDDPSHYEYMFRNGLKINGVKYFRISTSAGQGRVSTVTFCSSDILEAVNEILDNGRNKEMEFSPSKFNAYKGIYSSATKTVRTPRFCVVPDFESPDTFDVNWVTETKGENDDLIETRTLTRMYNRWDGMGLVSPSMAEQWAEDLGIDYIPSQFCVRQSFIKGMLCVFPFEEFCEKKNNGNYIIKSIYKDENGNDIHIDLREVDVILTESQFKLWNSYISLDDYINNCEKHNLKWGVSLYVDKELPTVLRMNYQFLQATNIPKEHIEELCKEFVEWIKGVNSENIYYSLLFLLGVNGSKTSIEKYLHYSNNYWVKSLIVNHKLIEDKYIKKKIYNLIKTKIENACLGVINLTGNYQVIVSDPYGMMQYLCGHEVTGLIGKGACYSKFWSDRSVTEVDAMRAPLTYRSEHVVLNIENTEEQRHWFRYCYGGIILNIHGHETDNFAGSDFDFDILATTSNKILIDSVYRNEMPVVYEAPKPAKFIFTEEDLYKSDLFSFGSIIGAITNKSTSGFALLSNLEKEYGKDSREYKTTTNRIKMCTKLQSAQIDKAKIGREVKGIPKLWTDRSYIDKLKIEETEKQFLKSIMLDRHPYFFIYLYPDTKKKYKKYIEKSDLSAKHKFGISLNDLLVKEEKSEKEIEFINNFHKYMPVIISDSVMNNICKYIESVNFDIKNKIKVKSNENIFAEYLSGERFYDDEIYNNLLKEYKLFKKDIAQLSRVKSATGKNKYNNESEQQVNIIYEIFMARMEGICSNITQLVDHLVLIFYYDNPSSNKDLLWNCYGEVIFENIKNKNEKPILFPLPDPCGDIDYLNQKYALKEVEIW